MRVLPLCALLSVLLSGALHAQAQEASGVADDCTGITDHNQTVQCLHKQNQMLNHELKNANADLLDKLKAAEQTLPKRYRGKLLSRSKRASDAWEKYRSTQCDYERMHALGGIEEPIVDLQCKNELGKQRLMVLREQIKMWSY
jgi:uncharacterized protein YecT (DUF1311 family)